MEQATDFGSLTLMAEELEILNVVTRRTEADTAAMIEDLREMHEMFEGVFEEIAAIRAGRDPHPLPEN